MNAKIIKQFGFQRSGTNAIKALIEINFEDCIVVQSYLGNKHDVFDWDILEQGAHTGKYGEYYFKNDLDGVIREHLSARKLLFIINIKDPLSWLCSYFHYRNMALKFKKPELRVAPVFDLAFVEFTMRVWKRNITSWLNFAEAHAEQCFVFQHETLLSSPEIVLTAIRDKFDLKMKADSLCLIDGYTMCGTDTIHGLDLIRKHKSVNREYHLKCEWISKLDDAKISAMLVFMDKFFKENRHYLKYFSLEHLAGVERIRTAFAAIQPLAGKLLAGKPPD